MFIEAVYRYRTTKVCGHLGFLKNTHPHTPLGNIPQMFGIVISTRSSPYSLSANVDSYPAPSTTETVALDTTKDIGTLKMQLPLACGG